MTQELDIAEKAIFQEYWELKSRVMNNHDLSYIIDLEEPIIRDIAEDSTDWVKELPKLIEVYQVELIKIIKGIGEKTNKKCEKELFKNVVYNKFDNKEKSNSLILVYDSIQDIIELNHLA